MLTPNESYHAVLQQVLSKGKDMPVSRGQAHGTREIFARDMAMAMHFDLTKGLPVITTKMVWLHGVLHELIWFLSGDTNIKYLLENKVNIWNDNAYDHYCKLTIEKIWSKEVFLDRTIHDFLHRSVVAQVYHFNAGSLNDPAHDIDSSVVAVKKRSCGYYTNMVFRFVILYLIHDRDFGLNR